MQLWPAPRRGQSLASYTSGSPSIALAVRFATDAAFSNMGSAAERPRVAQILVWAIIGTRILFLVAE
jgi:hypothetical protein